MPKKYFWLDMEDKKIISSYKVGIFRHPISTSITSTHSVRREFDDILKQLGSRALNDEHEINYFLHAYLLISQVNNKNLQKGLRTGVFHQMVRYMLGHMEILAIGLLTLDLLDGNLIFRSLLLLLFIECLQNSLQNFFQNYEAIDLVSFLKALTLDVAQEMDLSNLSGIFPKKTLLNGLEFAETNLSFFYRKISGSAPPIYEFPADLQDSVRRLNQL